METLTHKKNDRNTTLLQQVYNSSLTWDGPHTLWDPTHVRRLLYTCCKSVVRESVLLSDYIIYMEMKVEDGFNKGERAPTQGPSL
jgi:hypothetical protein